MEQVGDEESLLYIEHLPRTAAPGGDPLTQPQIRSTLLVTVFHSQEATAKGKTPNAVTDAEGLLTEAVKVTCGVSILSDLPSANCSSVSLLPASAVLGMASYEVTALQPLFKSLLD